MDNKDKGGFLVDRQRVMEAFADYTSHYDNSDGKIKLKIDHTYRVAALCDRIARSLKLCMEDVELAWVTGMLHDIGRFEQLRRFGTFVDAESIDHAHYGVKTLFVDGKIRDYLSINEESSEYTIIRKAIYNHSAYRVEEGLDERTEMFCDILRDADKIDILKVSHDVPAEVIYNSNPQEMKNAVVTEAVMEQFLEQHAILRSIKRTCVDNIVGYAALVFELVYPESLRIVKEQGYLEKLFHFASDNPVTREQFTRLRECMERFLNDSLH